MDNPNLSPETLALHTGIHRSEANEMSEGMFLTQGYAYESAEQARDAFAGKVDVYMYSRYANPTVTAFEERLAAIEGAERCFATSTGMSAVFVALGSILSAGDRLVASKALFGSTLQTFANFFSKWGIQIDYVDGNSNDAWTEALGTPAKAVFIESPTNPMQDVLDIPFIAEAAHAAGAMLLVDNVFATPLGQKPLELGADAVIYSATKHIDGQGRVLGGAILGAADYIDGPVKLMIRNMGATISPFNAWVLLKGLETMGVRVRAQAASALELASWLEYHPKIASLRYPLLPSHPHHERAVKQMTLGGTLVTVDLNVGDGVDRASAGAQEAAFRFQNGLQLFTISNNLGDAKSISTHPATTTHNKLSVEERAAVDIYETTVRLSIGLESVEDLRADLDRALALV
ncbi:O-succinylhomoserine sulfhydrylase [Demequina sp. NBRC 110055]|uniref:O-succinylhomoserine sulfhydrylase n=1 Tax=Demequina sp. NBRC 110055 TaxID=1570344 RepID=UPI000A03ADC5|nr:O-succinylhomoserine sulfhydrylase [Demequina sp. NBRC 110055]